MTKEDGIMYCGWGILVCLLLMNMVLTWNNTTHAVDIKESIVTTGQAVVEKIDQIEIPQAVVTESAGETKCDEEGTAALPFWYTAQGMADFVDLVGPRIREYPEVIAMMEYFLSQSND
jgi:hypothetical protein